MSFNTMVSAAIDKEGCRGLVPRVPWVAGYDPIIWIQLIPSSGKTAGNHTPRTRYDHTTLG
jgi:hypothetical protein